MPFVVAPVAADRLKAGADRSLVQPVILWTGLAGFVLVFGSYGFIAPWGGDFNVYIAAVHALYRDLLHPSDVSLGVPSGNMVFYGPYEVLVAAIGKAMGVTPYRALEFAGIANVALYAAAIAAFCRRFSRLPQSAVPPLLLVAVILVLRMKVYSWSSETSYITLGITQAYASLLGWALALFSFVVADHVVQRPSAAGVCGLALLLAVLVLIHPISATWAIGITGLRALYVLLPGGIRHDADEWEKPNETPPRVLQSACLVLATVLGVALSLLWPYYSPLMLTHYTGVQEQAPFLNDPFGAMAVTYVLAVLALLLSGRMRFYQFWILAFFATFAVFEILRSLGIAFVARYALFMAFFAQFIVADCGAVAFSQIAFPWRNLRRSNFSRAADLLFIAVLGVALLKAPPLHAPVRGGILSLHNWIEGQSSERAFYAKWDPLRASIHENDVLMIVPSWNDDMDIAAVTGAKVVAAALMVDVPDADERTHSVQRFFQPGQSVAIRLQELKRWHATKVVLIEPVLGLAGEMESLFGKPLWRDSTRIVFAAGTSQAAAAH